MKSIRDFFKRDVPEQDISKQDTHYSRRALLKIVPHYRTEDEIYGTDVALDVELDQYTGVDSRLPGFTGEKLELPAREIYDTINVVIPKEKGIKYVDFCGDTNDKLHRKGDIAQGMHLESFIVKNLPFKGFKNDEYRMSELHVRFREIARYNEPLKFIIYEPEEKDDGLTAVVTGIGIKTDGTEFLETTISYRKSLEKIDAPPIVKDLLYKKEITQKDAEKFCDSIDADINLLESSDLEKYFISTFLAGVLCRFTNPAKLPKDRIPVWTSQKLQFYDFPEPFSIISIALNKERDRDTKSKMYETFYAGDRKIIEGASHLVKRKGGAG